MIFGTCLEWTIAPSVDHRVVITRPDGAQDEFSINDVTNFAQPNGLCFSRDERRLFVNDTERGHVRVFDVGADGKDPVDLRCYLRLGDQTLSETWIYQFLPVARA